MAKGEKTFSTKGQEVKRFQSNPLPTGEYDLKILGHKAEVKTSTNSKMPRVYCPLEAMNTGDNGGKNRWVFHNFFLSLKPGTDGVIMPNRGGQIVDFAAVLGQDMDFPVVEKPDAEGNLVEVLEPRAVLKLVKALDGMLVRGHVKYVPPSGTFDASNSVQSFLPSAEGSSSEDSSSESEEEYEENDNAEGSEEDETDGSEEVYPDPVEDEDSGEEDSSEDQESDETEGDEKPVRRVAKQQNKVIPLGQKKQAAKPAPVPAKKTAIKRR